MKKIFIYLTLMIIVLFMSCSKVENDPSPVTIRHYHTIDYKDNGCYPLCLNVVSLRDTNSTNVIKIGELKVSNDKDSLRVTYELTNDTTIFNKYYNSNLGYTDSYFQLYLLSTHLWVGIDINTISTINGEIPDTSTYTYKKDFNKNDSILSLTYTIPLSSLNLMDSTFTYHDDTIWTTTKPLDMSTVDSIIVNITYKPLYIISSGVVYTDKDDFYGFLPFNGFIPRTHEEQWYFFIHKEIDPNFEMYKNNKSYFLYSIYCVR